jgi:hypothetical protein
MRICLALAATLLMVQGAAAAGQRAPASEELLKSRKADPVASPITDRFALRVTYFAPSVRTELRLDQKNGQPGTDLRAEDDLGMDDEPGQGRVELLFRLREKNRLRVDYFKLTRFGDRILTQPVVFGDQTFNVSERAQTKLDWRMLGFTYTRSLVRLERFELGAGLGIHLLEADARGEVAERNVREHSEAVGAFPTVALDATWRISKRWSLNARGQTFTAHRNEFEGSLSDYHGDVQYRWRRNFALGLGYTSLRTSVTDTSGNSPGRYKQSVSGPELFIRGSF